MDEIDTGAVAFPVPPPPGFQYVTCDSATNWWDERWYACPVCAAVPDADGLLIHRDPEFLVN